MADIHLSESGLFIACLYDQGSLLTSDVVEAIKTSSCISLISSRGCIRCLDRVKPAGAECTDGKTLSGSLRLIY